jgi:hypothetical protein
VKRGPDPAIREYFEVSAALPVQAVLSGPVLTLLRGELATVWLDTEPVPEGWPAELEHQVSLARSRCQGDSGARRPGTGPATVVLDPRQDEDFALVTALTPFSRKVEVMSRQGQLVYASSPGSLRLRLTAAERSEFSRRLPEPAGLLTRTTRPRPSRGWRPVDWLAALIVAGPIGFLAGASDVHHPFRIMDGVWFVGHALLGTAVLVESWRFARSVYTARRRSSEDPA